MKRYLTSLALPVVLAGALAACGPLAVSESSDTGDTPAATATIPEGAATAVFGGGCFWCMEPVFEALDGVYAVTSGFSGSGTEKPSYEEVAAGKTDFVEAVEVIYDPERVDYERLLRIYWRNINPTDDGGQFYDRGAEYRTAIFVADDEQRRLAEESKKKVAASGRFEQPIVTEIRPAGMFFPAEEHHQDYYKRNADHYKSYRKASGRDDYFERVWGDD